MPEGVRERLGMSGSSLAFAATGLLYNQDSLSQDGWWFMMWLTGMGNAARRW